VDVIEGELAGESGNIRQFLDADPKARKQFLSFGLLSGHTTSRQGDVQYISHQFGVSLGSSLRGCFDVPDGQGAVVSGAHHG
jgi:hypothetical protein